MVIACQKNSNKGANEVQFPIKAHLFCPFVHLIADEEVWPYGYCSFLLFVMKDLQVNAFVKIDGLGACVRTCVCVSVLQDTPLG